MRPGALVLALFVLPAAAGAPAHAVTVSPVVISVTIDQVAFKESSVAAHVGDTIEWTNRDVIDHTATSKKTLEEKRIPGILSAKEDTESIPGIFSSSGILFDVEIPSGKRQASF